MPRRGSVAPAVPPSRGEIWKLPPAMRGIAVDDYFGTRLAPNFPKIDDFQFGIAISNKSIDLTAATYQNSRRLSARINAYIDGLARFAGARWRNDEVKASDIVGRTLRLIIPEGRASQVQRGVIEAAKARAETLGVTLEVHEF
jgi:hypothetical protein